MTLPTESSAARSYCGTELDTFRSATNWKKYWSSTITPFVGAEVLDVGAGIGATAHLLARATHKRWVALEPDPALVSRISEDVKSGGLPPCCEVRAGILGNMPAEDVFDTVIYADVLEHIERDQDEMTQIGRHLKPGGHLVVLCPAHEFLFTPFDTAVGHFRRYNIARMKAITPPDLTLVKSIYLDSAGVLASLANKLLLRSGYPTQEQIRLWDSYLVPLSRRLDPLTGFSLGKSVLCVWRKRDQAGGAAA